LLFDHSLFNGHPRFWGYITSSAAPIGALADLLASAVNANVGAWVLSPMATEIETQTVKWVAELIGYPESCGGLLVSGGNLANFVCLLAARTQKADWEVRKTGLSGRRLLLYCSRETHTWVEKAADLFGLGTNSLRWITTDDRQRLVISDLKRQIEQDLRHGHHPFLVVGNAGSVSTGAVDPLPEIAAVAREHNLWFHVDGAYGACAAKVSEAPADLAALSKADSVALDPHKWLYAPLEAGCVLVRDMENLRETYSYHPPYYHFGEEVTNYFDFGLQNSRGFRALKVWLALQQVGRSAYLRMIGEDIVLARELFRLADEQEDLEALTCGLSITTFRFVPSDLLSQIGSEKTEAYLNDLNQELLNRLEKSGEAFLSNAVIAGRFALRACIVNFRTMPEDLKALLEIVMRLGREADADLRRVWRVEKAAFQDPDRS
jgi:glutamate/tyrosine decarboxylase-like PLP-dependent enzyme